MKENSVVQDESIPHCMFIAFNGLCFQLKPSVAVLGRREVTSRRHGGK